MRLLREIPELEQKIESGALTLTNLGLAQTLFRRENFAKDRKIALMRKLENQATREAQKIIIASSAAPIDLKLDRVRTVAENKVEIRFVADERLNEKLRKLRGLLAHSHPNCSMAELIERACDISLEQLIPRKQSTQKSPAAPRRPRVSNGKYTPAAVRRETWEKANGKCENCGSDFALELDHRIPRALGGSNDPRNLRILCRSCNQRAAVEALGLNKMEGYLERGPSG